MLVERAARVKTSRLVAKGSTPRSAGAFDMDKSKLINLLNALLFHRYSKLFITYSNFKPISSKIISSFFEIVI